MNPAAVTTPISDPTLAFGRPVNTIYRFDQADVIVSLDADFLSCGPGNLIYARQFADKRRVMTNVTHSPQPKENWQEGYQDGPSAPRANQSASYAPEARGPVVLPPQVQAEGKPPDQTTLNRMYVVEPAPSPTGGMADHRIVLRASEIEAFAWELRCGSRRRRPSPPANSRKWPPSPAILQAHRGACVVVAGPNQPPNVHALAHAMNQTLGNVGKTVIVYRSHRRKSGGSAPVAQRAGGRHERRQSRFAADPRRQSGLFRARGSGLRRRAEESAISALTSAFSRMKQSALVNWHVPEAHYLESWSDVRGYDGTVSFVQPLIAPLYGGKTAHEVIATLAGQPDKTSHELVQENWQNQTATSISSGRRRCTTAWFRIPRSRPSTLPPKPPASAVESIRAAQGMEIMIRPDPTIWDGSWANNGWLQELPKPQNKMTWDNAAWISPTTAQKLNLNTEEMVELKYQGRSLTAPVFIMPGHANDSVTVHLGYGRTRAGHIGDGVGFNAYLLRTSGAPDGGSGLEAQKAGGHYHFATTQHTQTMEGRDLVRVATLDEYKKNPQFVDAREEGKPLPQYLTLYPDYRYQGYKWGMSIDLNACVGCSACVVACQAENNIAVVGKIEVARGRHMHWIRVDRYFKGNWDNPELYYQPVPCMHCENAPCELVCPVAATVHSGDGLNQMVYNRCVGTRYCSNNCPYKVRRFNFLLYSDWYTESLKGVRNPNVTVRSRGVMEKCTYCIQRINAAKIRIRKAKPPHRRRGNHARLRAGLPDAGHRVRRY